MKSMNNETNNDDLSNWLAFSLSPQLKMESNNDASNSSNQHFTHGNTEPSTFFLPSSLCYGVIENADFQSPLSVMEAISSSHSQVTSSSPKLEDFLSGTTMATQQFEAQQRDNMVLSLDTNFYNQEPFTHQNHHYFSGINFNLEIPHINEDEIPNCFKTWMDQNSEVQVNNNNNNVQSLSLSMSPVSQSSSCVTASTQISPTEQTTKKRALGKTAQKQTVHRKSIDTFGQRTSQYRGVTRHRWTGRYEAHLWDNSCKKEGQTRKGRQVYLGGYDMEEKAARAYDLAALKYWGPSTHINFPLENYQQELEETTNMNRQEYVAHLRRKSSGFSRGASIYRGVTRHHQHGRWQARIGRVAGNKDLYLGTFSTQEEAAEAYDIAAIKFRGVNAVTNFDISRYDTEKIMASNNLPSGETARRNKEIQPKAIEYNTSALITENCARDGNNGNLSDWKMVLHDPRQENISLKTFNGGDYQNPSFSAALHELMSMTSTQRVVDESTTHVGQQFSNASSLVTSFNSSREASPDKCEGPVPWIPIGQPKPVLLTTTHLPVFTAWNDA